jgi:hypothetical protein
MEYHERKHIKNEMNYYKYYKNIEPINCIVTWHRAGKYL